tara:strand:- start:73 stop:666 length:594 start_codon:yes stop_codon:yes gene_type:complete
MALTLNGSNNTIAGLAVGGLPDGTVDTDMLAASAVTAAKASGSAKGITEFDMWRVNSSADLGSDTTISANWERVDTAFEKIGTGLTQSSGIFTFPSTGKWLIGGFAYIWTSAAPNYCGIGIYLSTDSGGSYGKRSETLTSINDDESAGSVFSTACLDVTNSSTARMKLVAITNTTVQYNGHSDQNRTGLLAMKLGDT